jgi:MFS family permease
VYLVLSVPVGRLADRVGAARVFVAGYVALLALYAVLLLPTSGPAAVVAGILLFGGYYAANDGVLMALASETLPAHLRTTGLALLTTTVAIARLVSAVLFGALWSWYGSGWTVGVYAAALLVAIPIAAVRLHAGAPPVTEAA